WLSWVLLPCQFHTLQGTTDRGLANAQVLGHLAVRHSRMEPAANERQLALVQLAMTARTLLGHQAIDAVLTVLPFPTGLCRYIVAKSAADFFLPGQFGLTQRDGHQT